MSYTKTYFVSTIKDGFYKAAIVSSGHARGALQKFLMHTDPDALSEMIGKTLDEYRLKKYNINNRYEVEVKRINVHEDFTALPFVKVEE